MKKLLIALAGAIAVAAGTFLIVLALLPGPNKVTTIPKPPAWQVWSTVGNTLTVTDTPPSPPIHLPVGYVWSTINGIG